MRKWIVVFLVFFVSIINLANAQLVKNYGFKIGFTNSNEDWNYNSRFFGDFDTDSKLGLNISGFVEFLDIPFISVVAEVGYNQKGMEQRVKVTSIWQPEGTGEFKTMSNRVDYLEVALALKINYETPIITPYLFVGPRFDLLINTDTPGYEVIYDNFEESVYGLKLGVGSEIGNLLPYSLLVEFQYNYDLSNIYKTNFLKINNNSFEFKVGINL